MGTGSATMPKTNGSSNPNPSQFRSVISSDPDSEFPAERDRYVRNYGPYHECALRIDYFKVLYIHFGCPFAQRASIIYHLKHLHSIVGLSVVSIHLDPENGWTYDGTSSSDPVDPFTGFKCMRQLYQKAAPDYKGGYTVPVIWDRKRETIVSNDSPDILRMLITAFDELIEPQYRETNKPDGGLLPAKLEKEIDELNSWMNSDVNWGTYKCGRAKTQEDYDQAMTNLYKGLDALEERLQSSRYLFGNHITEADIRLFPTMVRFDMAYATVLNCNWKLIRYDYPALHRWLRQLYWEVDNEVKGGFKITTHFDIYMEGVAHGAMKQKLIPWGPKIPIMPLEA